MAEKHSLQVEILLKKTIPVGSAGSAGWLDNLEIRLNSAQLELELG